jgi:hypothetical protein
MCIQGQNLCSLPNTAGIIKSRKTRSAASSIRGELKHKNFGCKTSKKSLLKRTGHRYKDNIKMDLVEIGCQVGEWTELASG